MRFRVQDFIMTDVENLEKIIRDIFGVRKIIKKKRNTNKCIQPLNIYPLNMFAFNFINRLTRLNEKFKDNKIALNTICERVKNLGEAKDSGWAGPYSELVALDFYSQFSEFLGISYINLLEIKRHKESIPAINGQKEKIDIDLCLSLKSEKLFTDVKSFNCETLDGAKQQQLQSAHKRLLMTAAKQPPGVEVGKAFDLNMKPLTQDVVGSAEGHSVKLPNFNVPYAVIHTHPACGVFSPGDLLSFVDNESLKLMTAIGHNGHIFAVEKSSEYNSNEANGIVWQLSAEIDRLKNIPRAELPDEQLLEQAEKLVWQAIRELQKNGVKFYE